MSSPLRLCVATLSVGIALLGATLTCPTPDQQALPDPPLVAERPVATETSPRLVAHLDRSATARDADQPDPLAATAQTHHQALAQLREAISDHEDRLRERERRALAREAAARKAAAQRRKQARLAALARDRQAATSSPVVAATASVAALQDMARRELIAYGYAPEQWPFLDQLVFKESGWDPSATNPSSGAYGLPQALPGEKMAETGPDWATNPVTQIRWMLGYIEDRYGTPEQAWAHSEANGWY